MFCGFPEYLLKLSKILTNTRIEKVDPNTIIKPKERLDHMIKYYNEWLSTHDQNKLKLIRKVTPFTGYFDNDVDMFPQL